MALDTGCAARRATNQPPPPPSDPHSHAMSKLPALAEGRFGFGGGGWGGGALEGKGPQGPLPKRLDWRLEEAAKAVAGGYCRSLGGRWRGSSPSSEATGLEGGGEVLLCRDLLCVLLTSSQTATHLWRLTGHHTGGGGGHTLFCGTPPPFEQYLPPNSKRGRGGGGAREPSVFVVHIYSEGWILLSFSRVFAGWTR